jgi:hypothetical protein
MDENMIDLGFVTPDFVKAVAAAEKYWTAPEGAADVRDRMAGELGLDLATVERQDFAAHLDRERIYDRMSGPSVKNPLVRELACRLREAGYSAHAVAFLLGVPPKTVAGMKSAALAKRAADAEKVAVAS